MEEKRTAAAGARALGRKAGARLRGMALDTRPLRTPAYRRLLAGQAAAYVGIMLTGVAVPVQVYSLTRSSFYVGVTAMAEFVPIVVFGLYGGAIADRVDRRALFLRTSLLAWAMTLGLLVQAVAGLRSPAVIIALVAVQAAAFAVSSSTQGAIIPRIVPAEQVAAANTLNFTTGNLGQVLGPLAAGGLVALPSGFAWAYGADAALFTLLLHSALRLPPIRPRGAEHSRGLRSVYEGLRFIGTNPVLVMSFTADIAAMVLAMPRALFPEAAAVRFHGGVGPLYSAIAAGSLVAGLCSGWIGRVRRQGVALTLAVIGWAGAVALAGLAHRLWTAAALLMLAGAADLVSAVYRQTILQTFVPDRMRGRMQGVYTVVVSGGPRLGDLRAGSLAALTTLGVAWSGSALLCLLLVAVCALSVRPFWRYEAPHPAAPKPRAPGDGPQPVRAEEPGPGPAAPS
ncbi:MFS transporter [Streptomyces sp. NPDC050560]|uniref:MFS transporter n=1 Tax=Streptomyces sp. NPDC050560 TaxID=3365630 RepID=UPI0037A2C621